MAKTLEELQKKYSRYTQNGQAEQPTFRNDFLSSQYKVPDNSGYQTRNVLSPSVGAGKNFNDLYSLQDKYSKYFVNNPDDNSKRLAMDLLMSGRSTAPVSEPVQTGAQSVTESRKQNAADKVFSFIRDALTSGNNPSLGLKGSTVSPEKMLSSLRSGPSNPNAPEYDSGYRRLMSEPGFFRNSSYVSTEKPDGTAKVNAATGSFNPDDLFEDVIYDYINGNEKARDIVDANSVTSGRAFTGDDVSYLKEMTPDEVAVYNYLYRAGGRGQANRYIENIKPQLLYRSRGTEAEAWKKMADEQPVSSSLFSIAVGPLKSVSYAGQVGEMIGGGQIDPNAGYNRFVRIPGAIREEISEKAEAKWGERGSFGYQTTMSMGDFLYNSLISGGFSGGAVPEKIAEGLTLAIMGTGAAADTVVQKKDMGYDDTSAFVLGTIAGAAEIVTEKISLETLLNPDLLRNGSLKYILKNIAAEASEEGASDLINWYAEYICDIVSGQTESEWKRMLREYEAQGYTESEAFGMAIADRAKELGSDVLGGMISGGVMAGAGAAGMENNYVHIGNIIKSEGQGSVQSVIDEAKTLSGNERASRLANEVDVRAGSDNWRNVSSRTLGELAYQVASRNAALEEAQNEYNETPAEETAKKAVSTALSTNEDNTLEQERTTQEQNKSTVVPTEETTVIWNESPRTMEEEQVEMVRHFSKSYPGEAAQTFMAESYESGQGNPNAEQDPDRFAKGWHAYYMAGMNDEAITDVESEYQLTQSQKDAAYKAGTIDAMRGDFYGEENNADRSSQRGEDPRTAAARKRGRRILERRSQTEQRRVSQEKSAAEARNLSETSEAVSSRSLGIANGTDTANIRIIPSMRYNDRMVQIDNRNRANGVKTVFLTGPIELREGKGNSTARGVYSSDGSTIYIRADHSQLSIEQINDHENFHRIKRSNPEVMERCRYNILNHYSEKMLDDLVDAYVDAYAWTNMSADDILEEIYADAYAGIDIFDYMDSYEGATRFSETVKESVKEANVQESGEDARTEEHYSNDLTQKLRETAHRINDVERPVGGALSKQSLSEDRVSQSADSVNQNTQKTSMDLERRGVDLTDGSASKFSYDTWNDTDKQKVLASLVKAGFGRSEAQSWIKDVNSVAAIIAADRVRLDYEAADNQVMLKNNAEYVKTLDASTLCAKRLLYQGTFNRITELLPNSVLTPDDLIQVRKVMAERGDTVPCGICYVESRRKTLSKFAGQWLNEVYKGNTKVTMNDLTSTDGLERLRHEHPDVYNSYTSWMRKRGTANPKVVELRTSYRNDISKLTNKQIENITRIGGLRVQSFSDFETVHLIDMMQAILDMSAKKLTSQAYTKVPNFAWAFGDTGIKINLSLIGKAENGKLVFDSKEGMDIRDAMALRNRYSDNVGTILVGANDESILLAMADDRIDFIIPFHRSGWSKDQFEALGLKGYDDYQNYQNERNLDGSSIKDGNLYPIDYWDYNKTGKENAERYLEICKEQKRIPKFEKFLVDNGDGSWSLQPDGSTDGYWKMLIDFKMYNNEGVGAPQRAVTPTFNMAECERILNEYDGEGNRSLPVDEEAAQQFAKEYKKAHKGQKFSRDQQYMDAAKEGDYYTASVLLKEAAREAGYTNEGYHGTDEFGFTKIDPKKGDDKISFFITDDLDTAETYSNKNDIRRISDKGPTEEELNELRQERMEDVHYWASGFVDTINAVADADFIDYSDFDDDIQTILESEEGKPEKDVQDMIDGIMEQLYSAYLRESSEYEEYGEWYDLSDDAADIIAAGDSIIDAVIAYKKVESSAGLGNYHLFFNTDGFLEIDGMGKNWNRIEFVPEELQELKKTMDELEKAHVRGSGPITDSVKWLEASNKYDELADEYFDKYGLNVRGPNRTRSIAKYAYEKGYKGVTFKRIYDNGGKSHKTLSNPSNVYVLFDPQTQAKSADPVTYDDAGNIIPLSERFNKANNDIRYSRDTAPEFYSKLESEIAAYKGEKIGAASVISYLKGKGVKDEEIKWTGISTFLEGKKSVFKADLLQYTRDNQIQIEEEILGQGVDTNDPNEYFGAKARLRNMAMEKAERLGIKNIEYIEINEDDTEWVAYGVYKGGYRQELATLETKGTNWEDYKTPGGENYREILYKIPGSTYKNDAMDTHWRGTTGVLAHARIQDFETGDGKILFVDEIQSDWHNAGEKAGYASQDAFTEKDNERYTALTNEKGALRAEQFELRHKAHREGQFVSDIIGEFHVLAARDTILFGKGSPVLDKYDPAEVSAIWDALDDEGKAISKRYQEVENRSAEVEKELEPLSEKLRRSRRSVPDAPFRNGTYIQYVLKDLLRKAAEGGYDYLAWTTGKMQEDRWSSSYAEGYRIEYDQDIPKFLSKYGKQWGAKLTEVALGDPEFAAKVAGYKKDIDDLYRFWLRFDPYNVEYQQVIDGIGYLAENIEDATPEFIDADFTQEEIDEAKEIALRLDEAFRNHEITGEEFDLNPPVGNVPAIPITESMKESVLYKGQPRFSLDPVKPVSPSSDLWKRGSTTEEVMKVYPQLWNVAADESETRNPTQITSTVNTYRKIYETLKKEGFDGDILDASSGLGYGTRAGIEEYGFNVDDIEPYPDKSYKPKYTDYSKLNKKYDVIISNAVLNVVPQEQRDALVVKMGRMLKPGGRLFVNVRSLNEIKALQNKLDSKTGRPKNVKISDSEVAETSKGSYQKGFTKTELVSYLQDALEGEFDVKPVTWFGNISAIATKKAARYSRDVQSLQNDVVRSERYRKLDEQRQTEWDRYWALKEELRSIPSRLPRDQWSDSDREMVDSLGRAYAPVNPEWTRKNKEAEKIYKSFTSTLDRMNEMILRQEAPTRWADLSDLTPAEQDEYKGFRKNDTGTSMSLKGSVLVEMTPEEYLRRTAAMFNENDGRKTNLTMQIRGLNRKSIDSIKKAIRNGEKMYTPWIDERGRNGQEGRHRAAAAYELGIEKIPVVYWTRDRFSYDTKGSDLKEQNRLLNEELKSLKKELKKAQEENEKLKGEFQLTEGPAVDRKSVEKVARRFAKDYQTKVDTKEISETIGKLAEKMLGNDVDIDAVKKDAIPLARKIAENAQELVDNGQDYQLFKELMQQKRGIKVSPGVYADFPDGFNTFRKRNFGKINFKNDGVPIADVYREAQDMFGTTIFPDDVMNEADMAQLFEETLNDMRPVYENPYSYNMAEATEGIANDIVLAAMDETIKLKAPTFADKQKAELEKAIAAGREETRKAIERERSRRDEYVKEIRDRYAEYRKNMRDARARTEVRGKISRGVERISKLLISPTDKRHIPPELQKPVARLLEAINLDNGKNRVQETKRSAALKELQEMYSAIADDLVLDPDMLGDKFHDGLLDEMIALKGKSIYAMDLKELDTIWRGVTAIEASIRSANRLFQEGKYSTVSEIADKIREDNLGKDTKNFKLAQVQKLLSIDMLTPEAFMHRLGDTGDMLFKEMRGAQDKAIRIYEEAKIFSENELKGVDYQALEKEMHTVKLGGREAKMSTAQIMELYNLSKRAQALTHLIDRGGGISLKEQTRQKGVFAASNAETYRNLTMPQLNEIIGLLTPEQLRIAEAMQVFVSTVMAGHGNEAAMQVYGYEKFGDPHYWPIKTNDQDLRRDAGKTQGIITSVAGVGMAQPLTRKANNSIAIRSVFDTFSNHITEMANYASWLPVMEDINRVRNYTFRDEEYVRTGTMRETFDRVYGRGGAKYLEKLMADLANGVQSEQQFFGGFMGKFKASAVGANLRVIIQQPTAIFRAGEMLSPKYMAAGAAGNYAKGWKTAKKYSAIATWKDWGFFDIHTGRQMKDILFENSSKLSWLQEKAMAGAGWADSVGWGWLWNSCYAEQKALNKGKNLSTEQLNQLTAKRFDDIVDHTQVVDGILQRSQLMRSGDGLTKMATSFMGEPTKQYNQFVSALYDMTHGGSKAAKKHFARATATLLVSAIINAVAQSIMDAVRNDDRDKKYWEKFAEKFTGISGDEKTAGQYIKGFFMEGNLGEAVNPAGYIPYVKDVWSIIEGYNVDRMDVSVIEDLTKTVRNLMTSLEGGGKNTVQESIINAFNDFAKLCGLPFSNVKRDLLGIANTVMNEFETPRLQYELDKFMYRMNGSKKTNFKEDCYQAYKLEKESFEYIYNDLIKKDQLGTSTDSTQEVLDKYIEKRLKEDFGENHEPFVKSEKKKEFQSNRSALKSSAAWKQASEEQRDKAEKDLLKMYQTPDQVNPAKDWAKVEAGKQVGVTAADVILYDLAFKVVDQPSYGSASNEERKAALDLMGVSGEKADWMWLNIAKGSEKSNPYK